LRFHNEQTSPAPAYREHLLNQDGKQMTFEEAARLVEGIPDEFDSLNASEFFSKNSGEDEDQRHVKKRSTEKQP
jgi:hypothetical protein